MAKYLQLKHDWGGPARAVDFAPMDQCTPDEADGSFVGTKDLIAGWYVIDVESWDRAVRPAGASGSGGRPIELEVPPFLGDSPTGTE